MNYFFGEDLLKHGFSLDGQYDYQTYKNQFYLRLACPRVILERAMNQIRDALAGSCDLEHAK